MAIQEFPQLLAQDIHAGLDVYSQGHGYTITDVQDLVTGAIHFMGRGNVEGHRQSYKQTVKLLLQSRVGKAILATDWSVEREDDADFALGLRRGGIANLKNLLAFRDPSYGMKHIHLDKGQGNGKMIHNLRRKGLKSKDFDKLGYEDKQQSEFLHVGIGDSLYYSIDGVLLECLEGKYKKNTHVLTAISILSQLIQLKLREKWYEPDSDYAVGKWIPKEEEAFDLNDIYTVLWELQNDDNMVRQIFDMNTGQINASRIFERDATEVIDIHVWYTLLLLLGKNSREIQVIFTQLLSQLGDNIERIKKGIEAEKSKDPSSQVSFRLEKLEEILGNFQTFHNSLKSQFQVGQPIILDEINTNGKTLESISDVCSSEFISAFTKVNSPKKKRKTDDSILDLNELPEIYFKDYVAGYFTNIPNIFEHYEQFMLITSIRSDSHENETNFKHDIVGNLKKLAAGGVLITDGMSESFSGRSRLDIVNEIISLPRNKGQFKAEAIYDPDSMRVVSIMIQKKSSFGYITDEEKATFISPSTQNPRKVVSLEEAEAYVGVYIEDKVREKIIQKYRGKVEKLRGRHDMIPIWVEEVLRRTGLEHNEPLVDNDIKEIILSDIDDVLELGSKNLIDMLAGSE